MSQLRNSHTKWQKEQKSFSVLDSKKMINRKRKRKKSTSFAFLSWRTRPIRNEHWTDVDLVCIEENKKSNRCFFWLSCWSLNRENHFVNPIDLFHWLRRKQWQDRSIHFLCWDFQQHIVELILSNRTKSRTKKSMRSQFT